MGTNATALDYLADLIASYRERTPAFSFRWLAERCGLKSPNYVQQVLSGKRGLNPALAARLCSAIKASDEQRETLLLLLKRDESPDPRVRALIDVRLEAMAFEQSATQLRPHEHVLFQTWFAPVLWVFSNGRTELEIARTFAALCGSLVNQRDVDRVLADLVRCGLLVESNAGTLEIRDDILQGKTQVSPAVLRTFYQMCAAATRKLLAAQDGAHSAGLQSLSRVTTFSADPARRERLGERIAAFHKELISEFGLHGEPAMRTGTVVQVATFAHQFALLEEKATT